MERGGKRLSPMRIARMEIAPSERHVYSMEHPHRISRPSSIERHVSSFPRIGLYVRAKLVSWKRTTNPRSLVRLALRFCPMRRLLLVLILGWGSLPARGQQLEWLTDASAAQEKAKRENKLVLLDFTGSDWCGWCMKLKQEVFDQPEFADFARANLVLVEVDFPRRKPMEQAQIEANQRLGKAYGVTGFPTIIVLDQDGRLVGRTGYMPGGPQTFDANLERILKANHKPPQAAPEAPADPPAPRKPAAFKPIPPAVPIHYGPLALKGISGPKGRRSVLINNSTLMVGETAKVTVENRRVEVCCKEIRDDSVLITADGKPMELKFGGH